MLGILFIVVVVCVVMMFFRNDRPTALKDGQWQLIDHRDGPFRNTIALVATLASIPLTNAMVHHLPPSTVKQPAGWLLIGLLVICIYLWLIWRFGSRVLEALNAAPGELVVDNWPLAAGEHITVTYRRKFHGGVPAGDMHAYLVLYELARDRNLQGERMAKKRREIKRVRLDKGEAAYRNKELVATWRFQVPNESGNPSEALARMAVETFFLDRHTEKVWWEFQVDTPLRGGGQVDSQFKLKIEMIAGRSQWHMGH